MAGTEVGSLYYDMDIDPDNRADRRLDDIDKKVKKFGDNIESTGRKSFASFSQHIATSFNGVADSIAGLARMSVGLFAGGAFGIGAFVKQASDLQSIRASFESMTGSAKDATKVLQQLNKFSFETAFSSADINKAAQLLLGAGVEVKNLGKYMKQIGDIAGATGADLGALTLPLSQALGRGKLQTQDFYQILNSGAGTFRKVLEEEVVKRGLGNLQDALANGTITTEVLTAALENSNKKGGFAFEGAIKQSKTFAGQLSNLQETIGKVGLKILGVNSATGEVDPKGIFAKMSKAVQDATEWLNKNKDAIKDVTKYILDNAVPAVLAIAGAWAVVKTAAILASIASSFNPFTLVAIAIAAIVAGIIFLETKFGFFSKAFGDIKKALQPTIDWFVQYVWPALQQIGKFVGEQFKQAWDDISDAFKRVSKELKPIMPLLTVLAAVIVGLLFVPLILLAAFIVGVAIAIARLVGWISQVIAWLTELSVNTTKAMASFVGAVVNGINGAIAWFAALPGKVLGAIGALGGLLYRAGVDLINGLINGVVGTFSQLASRIKNAVGGAVQSIKNFLGIHSPSKVFHEIGENVTKGFVNGINANAHLAAKAMGSFADAVIAPTVNLTPASATAAGSGVSHNYGGTTITIGTVEDRQDADYIINRINQNHRLQARGVAP